MFLLLKLVVTFVFLESSFAERLNSFNPLIKCTGEDCRHVTLSFDYKSKPFTYNLIRQDNFADRNFQKDSTINRHYIDDYGTPLTAIRIGNSQEGVQGVITIDAKARSIAFDKATGLHYFEAEKEDTRMQTQFEDDVAEPNLWFFQRTGDIGGSDSKNFSTSEPFPLQVTITIDKAALANFFAGDEEMARLRVQTMFGMVARYYAEVNVNLTLREYFVLKEDIGNWTGPLSHYFNLYTKAVSKFPKVNFHHVYHGLTGAYLHGTEAVGWGWLKGVCNPGYNVGVSTLTYDGKTLAPLIVAADILAHEIGHNLFLKHDPEYYHSGCTCDDPSGVCIMYYVKANSTNWSSCSKQVLRSLAVDIGPDPKNCPNVNLIRDLVLYIGLPILISLLLFLAYLRYQEFKQMQYGPLPQEDPEDPNSAANLNNPADDPEIHVPVPEDALAHRLPAIPIPANGPPGIEMELLPLPAENRPGIAIRRGASSHNLEAQVAETNIDHGEVGGKQKAPETPKKNV